MSPTTETTASAVTKTIDGDNADINNNIEKNSSTAIYCTRIGIFPKKSDLEK